MKNDHHAEKEPGFAPEITRRRFLKTMRSGSAIAAVSDTLTGRDRVRSGSGGRFPGVLGGAAPVPWPSAEAEKIVKGSRLDWHRVAKAAEVAVKNAEPMEQNE